MKTIKERFWSKVDKSNLDGCWIWKASLSGQNGYGFFRIGKKEGCTTAHRFSYTLDKGIIPEGMLVCHSCDKPTCVNPNHLFLGTHRDNAIDRQNKGRGSAPRKLTLKQVKRIKSSTISQSKLALQFKVSRATIAHIQYGQTWAHIKTDKISTNTQSCKVCSREYEQIIHKDMNYKYRRISTDICLTCDKAIKLLGSDPKILESAILYLLDRMATKLS